METNNLYERDFYAWIMHNVKLLKDGKLSEIDTYLPEALEKAYPKAVQLAHKETKLSKESFPKNCPYSLEEILDDDFYPSI